MKIGFCQYSPSSDPEESMKRALQLIADTKITKDNIDLLIFPELAFSNYLLSFDDAKKVAENEKDSKTIEFCQELSIALDCWVFAGFVLEDNGLFNAMCAVKDQNVCIHRKTKLYYDDLKWAKEGQKITTIDTEFGKIMMALGTEIDQMDEDTEINEFSSKVVQNSCDLIVCCASILKLDSKDLTLENYAQWFQDLIGRNCKLALCNRIGMEQDDEFAGHSCTFCFEMNEMKVMELGCCEVFSIINVE